MKHMHTSLLLIISMWTRNNKNKKRLIRERYNNIYKTINKTLHKQYRTLNQTT